jgi:hypothetical protein
MRALTNSRNDPEKKNFSRLGSIDPSLAEQSMAGSAVAATMQASPDCDLYIARFPVQEPPRLQPDLHGSGQPT